MTTDRKPSPAEEMERRSPFRSERVQKILRRLREKERGDDDTEAQHDRR